MSSIYLGVDPGGRAVTLALPVLIRTRMLIAASSGGGKSWTIRRLLEQTHGKVQQIVLDYEGEFATLRERYDFVLVGKGGEVAADPRYAPQLARRLLELGVSAVIDLYELKVPDRHAFVKLFLNALINLPKELWKPCMVVVDEAHVFCPEKGKGESEASGAVIDLATRGRKRAYCAVLATQDIAKLNKDASGECRNRIIGLAVEDKTRKRSGDELGFTDKQQILSLRTLEPGQFYTFGPAIGNEVRKVNIGAVHTSHPDVGTKAGREKLASPPPPREKVRAVLSKLADLPKEAAEEAQGLVAARRRIVELERELKQRPQVAAPEVKVERIEVPVLKDGQFARVEKLLTAFSAETVKLSDIFQDGVGRVLAAWEAAHGEIHALQRAVGQAVKSPPLAVPTVPRARPPVAIRQARAPSAHVGDDSETRLGRAERKILSTLVQYPQGRTKTQVAVLTGYAVDGGGFNNALGALRSKGYIGGLDILQSTPDGLKVVSSVDPLPAPGPELLAHWMGQLGAAEREILRVLAETWPQALTKEAVAAETRSHRGTPYEASGGGFNNAMGRLRTLELIEGRGEVKASDDLMGGT